MRSVLHDFCKFVKLNATRSIRIQKIKQNYNLSLDKIDEYKNSVKGQPLMA